MMPASDLHDPECRDATGVKVKYLYCPGLRAFQRRRRLPRV